MAKVRTEKELADAIEREEDTIEIEGDLSNKTVKIRATGNVAWAIAIGAIGLAVYAAISMAATGGTDAPLAAPAVAAGAAASVGVMGTAATYSAIAIAVSAGGIGVLSKLRKYREISRTGDTLVLKRVK